MNQLYRTRITSFIYSAGTLVCLAVLGALSSPDFATLVKANFGEGFTAMLILLLSQQGVFHARNLLVTKKLGSSATEWGKKTFLI